MHFSDLNDDALLCILDAIDCEDLDAFCSVNRRVYDLAVVVLREHIKLKRQYYRVRITDDYEFKWRDSWEGHPVNILHEIQSNPSVVYYIRELEFRPFEHGKTLTWNRRLSSDSLTDYKYSSELRPLTQQRIVEHYERLLENLAALNLEPDFSDVALKEFDPSYVPQAMEIDTSSLFVYLLTLATHVTRIHLVDPYDYFEYRCVCAFSCIAEYQGVTSPAPIFLKKLQTLRIEHEFTDEPAFQGPCMFFKSWTPITSLEAHMIGKDEGPDIVTELTALSSVQEMTFTSSMLRPDMVEQIIRGSPLRSFKHQAGWAESFDFWAPRAVLSELERHVASTLEELVLVEAPRKRNQYYRINSFSGFSCLKRFVIDIDIYFSDNDDAEARFFDQDDGKKRNDKNELESSNRDGLAIFVDFLTILPESLQSLDAIFGNTRIKEMNVEALRPALNIERARRLTKLGRVRLINEEDRELYWPAEVDEVKAESACISL